MLRVIDLTKALENAGGDLEIFREVAAVFLEDGPRVLARAEEAFRTGDCEGLARAAHTLKGSVSIFSAASAFDASRALENASRSECLPEAGRHLAQLAAVMSDLTSDLSSVVLR